MKKKKFHCALCGGEMRVTYQGNDDGGKLVQAPVKRHRRRGTRCSKAEPPEVAADSNVEPKPKGPVRYRDEVRARREDYHLRPYRISVSCRGKGKTLSGIVKEKHPAMVVTVHARDRSAAVAALRRRLANVRRQQLEREAII